jgi:hypothetical protein
MDADTERDWRCRCGHPRTAHQHYRGGTECALCIECPRYRSAGRLLWRLKALLRRQRATAE